MTLPDFMDTPYHVVIGGETGSGKTHLSNWLHSRTQRISIFFNSAHVPYVNGARCQSLEQVAGALAEGYRRINFVPPLGSDEESLHEGLTRFLFSLGEQGYEFLLITDEVHEFAPSGAAESSALLQWRKGRNYGVKNVGLSQEFRSVNHTVLTQSKHKVWIGPPNDFEQEYFNRYNIPYERLKGADLHKYHVVENGEIVETGKAPQSV